MNISISQLALEHYDIGGVALIAFIGQSQNTTFRVEALSGDKFLLRVHMGLDDGEAKSNQWQEQRSIKSELLWLQALAQETPLRVQRPVANRDGEWVTELPSDHSEHPLHCTLLHWVEGERIESEPTERQVRQLSKMMADLHDQASQWTLPSDFFRPQHDAEQLEQCVLQLHSLVSANAVSTSDYEVLQQAAKKASFMYSEFERNQSNWSLIHADLHEANYIFLDGKISPIDFGRCGFGFHLYDIALSLGYLNSNMRSHFVEAYLESRNLPSNYERALEAFFVSAVIENFAFLSVNPEEHEWLSLDLPHVASKQFKAFLSDNNFLFG